MTGETPTGETTAGGSGAGETGGGRCPLRSLVDAHFRGRIRPADERRMRAHLPDCAACRTYYERHLALATVDPAAPAPVERLAAGLGFGRRRRPWLLAAPAFAAVAAALVVIAVRGGGTGGGGAFDPRGGSGEPTAQVHAWQVGEPAPARLQDGDRIPLDAELAFAYENPSGWRHLLVFAVDDQGTVYWYHPGWERAEETPSAVPIVAGAAPRELPAAIRHDIRGTRLWVHAVFSDRPLDVRSVEALVAGRSDRGAPLPLDDTAQTTLRLEVAR